MIIITLETYWTAAKSDGRSDSRNPSNSLFHFLYKPTDASSLGGWFLTFRRTWPLRMKQYIPLKRQECWELASDVASNPGRLDSVVPPLSNHQAPQSSITDCVCSTSHSRHFRRRNCNRAAPVAMLRKKSQKHEITGNTFRWNLI